MTVALRTVVEAPDDPDVSAVAGAETSNVHDDADRPRTFDSGDDGVSPETTGMFAGGCVLAVLGVVARVGGLR